MALTPQISATAGEVRGRREEGAARLSLASNTVLVVVKITAGLATGSISVLAEGFQSTMDVLAAALILVTVRAAAKPPDESHPYGHEKFENLASVAQMILILGTAAYLIYAAWDRWNHPSLPRVDWGVAALGVSVVVNILVSRHMMAVGKETGSLALQAEATHLRSDMLSCVGVLVGLVAVALTGNARLDPAIAGVMTLVVVYSALRLLRDALRPLLDERIPPEEEAQLRDVLESDQRVLSFHKLRTRQAGSRRLVDVHVLLDDGLTFSAAHAVSEDVEGQIRDALPNVDVIVHAEPFQEEVQHQRERHGAG